MAVFLAPKWRRYVSRCLSQVPARLWKLLPRGGSRKSFEQLFASVVEPGDFEEFSLKTSFIAASAALIVLVFLLENWLTKEPRSRLDHTLGVYLPRLEMQGRPLHSSVDANNIGKKLMIPGRTYPLRWSTRGAAIRSNALRLSLVQQGNCSTAAGLSDVEHNLREKAQHYHPSRLSYVLGVV